MANKLVPVAEFCKHYNVEVSFIQSLNEYGLTEITVVKETPCIYEENIRDLEKIMRLHYDLDINLEGIEAISHLLHRLDDLQHELLVLKNQLKFYKED